MCLFLSYSCVLCVWENFVDYQWNESSGQTTFSRPVYDMTEEFWEVQESLSGPWSVGGWVEEYQSIYFLLKTLLKTSSSFPFSAFLPSPFKTERREKFQFLGSCCIHPTTLLYSFPLLMLYYNFLIGFSSLLISWLFKQHKHTDTQTKARSEST